MAFRTRYPRAEGTPFRRAAKSLESWVLSDFGRLSMTRSSGPHSPPILRDQPSRTASEAPLSPTSFPSSPPWTTTSSAASSVSAFPQMSSLAPSYAPPSPPRGHADWAPDGFPLVNYGSRSRQLSTTSTSSANSVASSASSVASTSGFVTAASSTVDPDELPDYDAFLKQQGEERIKPFLNDDREVFQTLREVEGSDFEEEEVRRVGGGSGGGRRGWR